MIRWGRRNPAAVLLLTGLVVTPALVLVREKIAANDCTTLGGTYDYLRALCFRSPADPASSVSHNLIVWLGVLLGAKLTAIAMFPFRYSIRALARRALAGSMSTGALVLATIREEESGKREE